MKQKLVLDCDTGTDDAIAIMLAALHPELELLAVTTVNGNVEVAHCTDNTLRTLALIRRENIPVYEGLARPIVRPDFPEPRAMMRNPRVHLTELPFPPTPVAKQALTAPEVLIKIFREAPGEIVLVAVGPLSNLAAAIALDPSFPGNVSQLIIMGGAVSKSNVTPSAEFNIWADPEAAAVVLGAKFPKITMVPLDATHQALVSLAECETLRALNGAAGKGAAELIAFRISGYEANQPDWSSQRQLLFTMRSVSPPSLIPRSSRRSSRTSSWRPKANSQWAARWSISNAAHAESRIAMWRWRRTELASSSS